MPFGYDLNYFFNNDTMITVQLGDPPLEQPTLVRLVLLDNLSLIRKELGKDNVIDDTLSFSMKIQNDNNNNDYKFAEIVREKEESFCLNEIIDKSRKILYLIKSSKPNWKFLNNNRNLDYGRTMSFD